MKRLFTLIVIVLILFTIINVYVFQIEREERRAQNKTCVVITKDNKIKYVLMNNYKYDFTERTQKLFINQFDKSKFNNLETCIQIKE